MPNSCAGMPQQKHVGAVKLLRRVLISSALFTQTVGAQNVTVQSDIICSSCSVVVERVTDLDPVEVSGEPYVLASNAAGAVYYYDPKDKLLKVFEPSGRLLRTIGRFGSGPGEYQYARNVLIASDQSVHILDPSLMRRTVYAPDGRFLRSNSMPVFSAGMGTAALILPSGYLIINSLRASNNDAAGFAVEAVGSSGRRIKLLEEASFEVGEQWPLARILAGRSGGGFIAANPFMFTVNYYAPDLRLTSSIERVAEWLTPRQGARATPSDGVHDIPPTPKLVGVWEDPGGRLWLQLAVASPRWVPGPSKARAKLERINAQGLIDRPRYDTVFEVIDPARKGVLARVRMEGYFGTAIGAGKVMSYAETPSGEPEVTIWRFRLKQ